MVGRPTVMMPLVKDVKKLISEGWRIVRTRRRFDCGGGLWIAVSCMMVVEG